MWQNIKVSKKIKKNYATKKIATTFLSSILNKMRKIKRADYNMQQNKKLKYTQLMTQCKLWVLLSRTQKYCFIFLEPSNLLLFDKNGIFDLYTLLITQIFFNLFSKSKVFWIGERWAFKMVYIYILFKLTCYVFWSGKLGKYDFSHNFQV